MLIRQRSNFHLPAAGGDRDVVDVKRFDFIDAQPGVSSRRPTAALRVEPPAVLDPRRPVRRGQARHEQPARARRTDAGEDRIARPASRVGDQRWGKFR